MMPGKYDLELYRGDTWAATFVLWADDAKTIPLDLTTATAAAEIRDKSGGPVIVPLDVTITAPAAGEIAVGLNTAEWEMGVPIAGVWDLQLTYASGVVQTPVAGKVTVTGDVTDSTLTTAMVTAARGARRELRSA